MFLINKLKISSDNLNFNYNKEQKFFNITPININKKTNFNLYLENNKKGIYQFKINNKLINYITIFYNDKINYIKYIPIAGLLINFEIKNNKKILFEIFFIDYCSQLQIFDIQEIKINKFVNIIWDKILIINLLRRSDRRNTMIQKLINAKIENWEFIEAIDGNDELIIKQYNKIKLNTKIPTLGHFGCLLSHIKAIEYAKTKMYKSVLILEDDIEFDNIFLKKINILVPQFDILYLGGPINELKLFLNGWAFHTEIMGCYCYLVKSHMYNIILDKWKEYKNCSDIILINEIQQKYNIVLLNDYIRTKIDDTDTSSKNKKMIRMINQINNKFYIKE